MPQVWTRKRAGTASLPNAPVRNPVAERPEIHLIELPLDWGPRSTQVYLIEGEPLTLIDTGVRSEPSRLALEGALEGLGYSLRDIERVVVTHAHREHFGLVARLRAEGGDLECCVHEADSDLVSDFEATLDARLDSMDALFRAYGVPEALRADLRADRERAYEIIRAEAESTPVDRRLREGDRIEWKDWAMEVLHAPGHTPGHILLHDEALGLLFTGDFLMGQAVPQAENFHLPGAPDPRDPLRRPPRFRGLFELRRSLRRLRGRPFKLLLPGYGGVIKRADRTIRATLLHYEVRLQRIDRGLRRLAAMGQDVTAYEIGKALFPRDEPSPEMREHLLLLIGALDCLEEDGLIVTEARSDGTLIHRHV